jgi:ABC-type lipoprotein release transport system permease subunit
MVGAWQVIRADLRRRWRSLVVLAVITGIVTAVVLVALAGARRTSSTYPRFRDATLEADASIEVGPEYFDAIAALPEVEAVAPASFFFALPRGLGDDADVLTIAGTDERFNTVVDRPLLLEGRRPDPDRADEALINPQIADPLGIEPGDSLSLISLTPEQMDLIVREGDPGEPAGPMLDVEVVGIGQFIDGLARDTPLLLLTPAFYEAHRDDIGHFDDILDVRLERGDRDLAAFRAGVARVVPRREGAVIETRAETAAEVRNATDVQAVSLYVFAIVAALAGFVAIGQTIARHMALASADQPVLRSLGFLPRGRFLVLLAPGVLVAIGGAALAVVLALLGSPILPTGFAREVEPDPGFAADWFVLGLGALAAAALVSARAAVAAAFAVTRRADAARPLPAVSRLLERLGRANASPSVTTGVRMALDPGRGRTAVPVRPAIAGAIAGVAGVVAALTFGAALHWLVNEPAAYGWRWDASVLGPRTPAELDDTAATLVDDDDVRGTAALGVLPVRLGGRPVGAYALESLEGGEFTTVLEGRAPTATDEVLVGSETLDRLDVAIGDSITVAGLEGSARHRLTIVGRGVFPEFVHPAVPDSDTGAYDDFALLTRAGSDDFVEDAGGEYFSFVLVRMAPGDGDAQSRLPRSFSALGPTNLPENLRNLGRVEGFPLLIGGFLVLLAMVAIAQTLVTSVRRRAHDLAVLETVGFVHRQVRSTIAWQGSTLAAIGLVLGIPIGIVVGRLLWSLTATSLGVDTSVDLPWGWIALAIPVTFVLVNLLALLPARAATRQRPAEILRSE